MTCAEPSTQRVRASPKAVHDLRRESTETSARTLPLFVLQLRGESSMVGKPNIPSDFESLAFLRGEAMPTPGLNALDQEREASMADEGGASGAHIEVQEIDIVIDEEPIPLIQRRVEPRSVGAVALSGLLLGGVALLLVGGALRLRG